ncbi:MAG TPA: AMP-binding protein, partial [Acidimicrobiales bacterium]|nr:AMP-binding protein [Acidimicrobiales bacterium]
MYLSQRVRQVLTIEPSSIAIITDSDSLPWKYVATFAAELSNVVASLRPTTGLSIGLIARNRAPHLAAIAACLANEDCLVTLSPMFSDSALATDIATLGLHVIMGVREDLDRPGVTEAALSTGAAVIEISEEPDHPLFIIRDLVPNAEFRVRSGVAIEMLSSGTTGAPKRISLTYENVEAAMGPAAPRSARDASSELKVQSRPALVWLPIVHISGAYFVIEAIYSARPTILMERFSAERWTEYVERFEVRLAHLNPAAMRMM